MLSDLWRRVKRNPVINAFIAAIIVQFINDYTSGNVDWQHITAYVGTLVLGAIARSFVVPKKEAEQARMRALAAPRPFPVYTDGDNID